MDSGTLWKRWERRLQSLIVFLLATELGNMVFAHASRSGGNCCSQPDCSVFIFPFTVGDQSRVGDSDCFSCLSQYLPAHSSVTTLLSPTDSAFSLQQNTCIESEEHTHTHTKTQCTATPLLLWYSQMLCFLPDISLRFTFLHFFLLSLTSLYLQGYTHESYQHLPANGFGCLPWLEEAAIRTAVK